LRLYRDEWGREHLRGAPREGASFGGSPLMRRKERMYEPPGRHGADSGEKGLDGVGGAGGIGVLRLRPFRASLRMTGFGSGG